jgi:glycosyltransferase involved in cell wall biosynthesis
MANRGVVALRAGCGGAEQAAYQLARQLAADGVEVTLVSEAEGVEETDGLSIVPLDNWLVRRIRVLPGGFARWVVQHLVGNIATARAVFKLLRENQYDVVHVHGSLTALLLARRASVPVVYTEHDATPWSCRYRRWWERRLRRAVYRVVNVAAFKRVDRVTTVFDALRTEMIARWGIDDGRVVTITNGADLGTFNPDRPGISLIRDEYGLDSYCLFVGRLTMRKAPDLVLRALVDCPGLNCAFVGDGPMRKRLEAMVQELGLAGRVVFTGNVDPSLLGRIYADADFLVLPSVSEGTPLVVVESLACGTPVLATRIAGAPALVRDWETGFLVRPGDLGELSMAVRFLAGDADLRRRMGAAGRELVSVSHVWPVIARRYMELYEDVAGVRDPLADELLALPDAPELTTVPA